MNDPSFTNPKQFEFTSFIESENLNLTPLQKAIAKYKRGHHGLFDHIEYSFNEDGSVRWRDMIKPEFLYVNRGWFECRQKEVPNSIEGLDDKQLSITLGGIKELAKLRGYSRVRFDLSRDQGNDYISSSCEIDWIPNYETDFKPVTYQDCANASFDNTDSFCHKFLETMACNRAFVRCVRNFLNIHIVGADEIDRSQGGTNNSAEDSSSNDLSFLKPYGLLEKTAKDKGISSFEAFKEWLREQYKTKAYVSDQPKDWASYSDIPAKECRILSKMLKG